MAIKNTRPLGHLTGGLVYTVTAADETDTYVEFDFKENYPIVANIMVTTDLDVNVSLSDAVITYPSVGKVRIDNGAATFTLTEDYKIHLTVQRSGTDLELDPNLV
jgi:hypothetical protein